MHPALALLAAIALAAPALAEEAGELKTFGDWVVGCDDMLTCTAIGMVTDLDPNLAYLKVARDAGAESGPMVSVTSVAWNGDAADAPMRLALEGGEAPLPVETLPGKGDGGYLTADLGPIDHTAFLRALLPATSLVVQSEASEEPASVSLSGISAALRYMDAVQGRAGGGTAIVAAGAAPADDMPGPPRIEPVEAIALRELDPAPALPEGVAVSREDCSEFADPQAFHAADGSRIFGTCEFTGAYNAAYRYWLVRPEGGEPQPLSFDLPGTISEAGNTEGEPSVLVNAGLSEDGTRPSAFNKGRGLGDCGIAEEWAFTGNGFRLVSYAVMPECRGVAPDDWPVLVSLPTR